MKRIEAACICQVLHFQLKDGEEQEYGSKRVRQEVTHYKESLDRARTKYKILEETVLQDGSIRIRIIKQYNQSPVGDYLN
ncbi:hypothetical protein [Angelakisella massiliensis]|uniref:hypothetical protein n=1 Tax=Angelakisella massiliensis TaxID=1871018 RepID=UPI0024B15442|nr:hypothetical protein [Angelakisella massiliensis]